MFAVLAVLSLALPTFAVPTPASELAARATWTCTTANALPASEAYHCEILYYYNLGLSPSAPLSGDRAECYGNCCLAWTGASGGATKGQLAPLLDEGYRACVEKGGAAVAQDVRFGRLCIGTSESCA